MKNSKAEICFIGNAIVDILFKISDEVLNKLEIPKGSMQIVDQELLTAELSQTSILQAIIKGLS